MATLNDLKRSITEITREEAFQLVLSVRANRRVQKQKPKRTGTSKPKVTKAQSIRKTIAGFNDEQKAALLELLKQQEES